MDPYVLNKLIPLIGIVGTMSVPLAIIWVLQHFKYKRLELEAELEARRLLGTRDRELLEARIERLESVVLMGLKAQAAAPAPLQPARELYEPPPLAGEALPAPGGKREPTR